MRLKKEYYITLIFYTCVAAGLLNSVQAQQTIELAGVGYHHAFTPSSGDPDFYELRTQATVPISYSDNYFFAALPRYNQTHIENLGFDLPSQVFRRINVPFIFQHAINGNQSIGGVLSPGIHSDFKDISREDWVLVAAIFMENTKYSNFHFRYGLVFSRQVTGMIIIPGVMFDWQPTDRISLNNNAPLAPEFSYQFSNKLAAGMILQRRGGSAKLSEKFQSRNIKDVRYEMAPYVDYKIWKYFVLRGAAGYTFSRKIQLFKDIDAGSLWNESFKGPEALMEKKFSGWFFNVGLRLAISRNE